MISILPDAALSTLTVTRLWHNCRGPISLLNMQPNQIHFLTLAHLKTFDLAINLKILSSSSVSPDLSAERGP